MSDKLWYKLDNSAKIMPSMTNNLNTNVFRLSCTLNEEVDENILSYALTKALEEFPMFLCTMKTGLFWHYLEKSTIEPRVEKENDYPCTKMKSDLLFRLSYYKKRINLEVYHVLTDGTGAMEFLKYIVSQYLNKKHCLKPEEVINDSSIYEKIQDDFAKFNKPNHKLKFSNAKKAYKFKFKKKESMAHSVIEAHMSCKKIKDLAKEYDTTVTMFLTAILIESIISTAKIKDLQKPIGITIPVNLRNIFPSKTIRNFFYTQSIQYKYDSNDDLRMIIDKLNEKFKISFSKDNLQDLLDSYMILEKFLLIRIIPTVLKDFILGLITGFQSTETMTLSNMGIVKMPEIYDEYIESFTGIMSSNDIHLTCVTYRDDLTLGFTSHFITSEVERTMILKLQSMGIKNIKVISNERK